MKRFILVCVVFLFTINLAESKKTVDHPRVSEAVKLVEIWLDAQRDYEGMPGISAAIVHDQNLIWSDGFGYSNPDKKSKTDSKTIYSICSISKLFTTIFSA